MMVILHNDSIFVKTIQKSRFCFAFSTNFRYFCNVISTIGNDKTYWKAFGFIPRIGEIATIIKKYLQTLSSWLIYTPLYMS